MDNRTVLDQIEKGFRMPKPTGYNIDCPDSLYDLQLQCWGRVAERRPTFEYLKNTLEDFFVATESNYRPPDEF